MNFNQLHKKITRCEDPHLLQTDDQMDALVAFRLGVMDNSDFSNLETTEWRLT